MTAFVTNRDEGFEDLLTELVDAHVDTIELFVARDDAETDGAHLDYLQGLVRDSKWRMAHRAGGPQPC